MPGFPGNTDKSRKSMATQRRWSVNTTDFGTGFQKNRINVCDSEFQSHFLHKMGKSWSRWKWFTQLIFFAWKNKGFAFIEKWYMYVYIYLCVYLQLSVWHEWNQLKLIFLKKLDWWGDNSRDWLFTTAKQNVNTLFYLPLQK